MPHECLFGVSSVTEGGISMDNPKETETTKVEVPAKEEKPSNLSPEFARFRKRLLLEHLLKSALIGLGAGLLVAAIVITTMYALKSKTYLPLAASLGGVAALLLTTALVYFLAKPSDKKIALRMDKEMHLQEKTATMVEFQNSDSLLVKKEREDADTTLKKQPTKAVHFKLASLTLPILLVTGACFTASFFTPAVVKAMEKHDQQTVDDKTDEIGKDVIDHINKSNASQEFKNALTKIVNDLVKDLEGDSDIASRREKVDTAKALVDRALDKANTKEEIGQGLVDNGDDYLKAIGQGLLQETDDDETNIVTVYAAFNAWQYEIVRGSFGILKMEDLKPYTAMLKAVFDTITYEKDRNRYYNTRFDRAQVEANIRKAFADLLAERGSVKNITVTDLSERAEITRGTFYNYYNNIYEVGAELQAEIEKELFAERREFNSTDDIEQYVDQIFAFLKQQESVYRQLLASDAPMAFMGQLESGMTQRVLSIMHEKGIDDKSVEFELLILASGTFAIVRKYYRNEVSVTLDDIRAYLSNKLRVLFEQYVK